MNYSTNRTQSEERIIIHYFIEKYKEFPKGKLSKTESPDFILNISPRKSIGIELTHLRQPRDENGISKVQINSLEREIVRKSQNLFEANNNLKLYITFSFNEDKTITKKIVSVISSEVSRKINHHIKHEDFRSPFYIKIQEHETPECIDSINILYHPNVNHSFWDIRKSFLMPKVSREIITSIIEEKNDKLPLYSKKKINVFWLVISTDRLNGSSYNIGNQIEKWNFSSGFQRVFLFELFTGKIFNLI